MLPPRRWLSLLALLASDLLGVGLGKILGHVGLKCGVAGICGENAFNTLKAYSHDSCLIKCQSNKGETDRKCSQYIQYTRYGDLVKV